MKHPGRIRPRDIVRFQADKSSHDTDYVATEEPLEIRVRAGEAVQTLAVTMRTPGHDFELAAGFLFSEGLITSGDEIQSIEFCSDVDPGAEENIVHVNLRGDELPDLARLERHFMISSACGVCGKTSLASLEARGVGPVEDDLTIQAETIYGLGDKLRPKQAVFEVTGGLHAAGLFNQQGELLSLREDVGRHNAVDKVVGAALLAGEIPLSGRILMVSGRSSFEILQKALVARIPVVCAVSAPSSLAVELAARFGITLVGFLRPGRFNVYTVAERFVGLPPLKTTSDEPEEA